MERCVNECLRAAEIQMSHSSIFFDPLYPFPEPDAGTIAEPINATGADLVVDNDAVWSYLTAHRQATSGCLHAVQPLDYVRRQLIAADRDEYGGRFDFGNFKAAETDELTETIFVALDSSCVRELIFDCVNFEDAALFQHLDAFMTNNVRNRPIKLSLRNCFGNGCHDSFYDCNWSRWPIDSFDLGSNMFGSGPNLLRFRSLIRELASNQYLSALNLSWNRLDSSAANDLNNLLVTASKLRQLNLCGNSLNNNECLRTIFKKVTDSVSILAELNLKLNGLRTANSLRPLIGFVSRSQFLAVLDLSFNFLNNDTASMLANCLRKHRYLHEIDLSGNLFDPDSSEILLMHLLNVRLASGHARIVHLNNCYVNATFRSQLDKIIDGQQPVANRYRIEGVLVSRTASIRTPTALELKTVLVKRLRFLSQPKSKRSQLQSPFLKLFGQVERKLLAKTAKNQHLPFAVVDRVEFDAVLAKSKAARRWKLDGTLINQVFEEWPATDSSNSLNLTDFLCDFRTLCDI